MWIECLWPRLLPFPWKAVFWKTASNLVGFFFFFYIYANNCFGEHIPILTLFECVLSEHYKNLYSKMNWDLIDYLPQKSQTQMALWARSGMWSTWIKRLGEDSGKVSSSGPITLWGRGSWKMVVTNCDYVAKSLITVKEGTFWNFLNGKWSIFKGCWLFF